MASLVAEREAQARHRVVLAIALHEYRLSLFAGHTRERDMTVEERDILAFGGRCFQEGYIAALEWVSATNITNREEVVNAHRRR